MKNESVNNNVINHFEIPLKINKTKSGENYKKYNR